MPYPAFAPPATPGQPARRGLRIVSALPATAAPPPASEAAVASLTPRLALPTTPAPLAPPTQLAMGPAAASVAPVTAAAPPSLVSRLQALLGKGAAAAQADPLGTVNAGLGLAGVVEYATARAPELPGRPEVYAPPIRPAQGLNPQALAAGRAQVQSTQRLLLRPTTSDAGTMAAQQLFAQAQAMQGQNELSARDNEAFQADQRRVEEQQTQAYQANYGTQRSYKEKVFDLGQRAYEARRQQGAAMSQAALTYFTQGQAAKQKAAGLAQYQADEQAFANEHFGWLPGHKKAAAEPADASPDGSTGYGLTGAQMRRTPGFHAKGGRLKHWAKGVASQQSSADNFQRSQTAVTLQTQRAFQESLREASKKRSQGIRK